LFADDAIALDLLGLAVGIGDDPVARQQARGYLAAVADADGVGEDVAILLGLGLVVEIAGGDIDVDGVKAFHGRSVVRDARPR
jgi:hypothetical protein